MGHKATLFFIRLTCCTCLAAGAAFAETVPNLPEAVSNNAVASLQLDDITYVASFSGISSGLTHDDIHARTFVYRSDKAGWQRAPDVPGNAGRLAAVAIAVGRRMYVFGGYTVDEDGSEVSTPWVHAFDPLTMQFTQLAPMPVPVDDAVAVSYQDRYIYLISGWHDFGNVNLVQVFDTEANSWAQATPIPGHSLFGHAGGIVMNQILYCDGVTIKPNKAGPREFVASDECFLGVINEDHYRRIDWHPVDPHPGRARYRMAAAGDTAMNSIIFIGGSDNPYNFNGIGYNGSPSEPSADTLVFDLDKRSWTENEGGPSPSMDHRGLVPIDGSWYTVGGMLDAQTVTGKVSLHRLETRE